MYPSKPTKVTEPRSLHKVFKKGAAEPLIVVRHEAKYKTFRVLQFWEVDGTKVYEPYATIRTQESFEVVAKHYPRHFGYIVEELK